MACSTGAAVFMPRFRRSRSLVRSCSSFLPAIYQGQSPPSWMCTWMIQPCTPPRGAVFLSVVNYKDRSMRYADCRPSGVSQLTPICSWQWGSREASEIVVRFFKQHGVLLLPSCAGKLHLRMKLLIYKPSTDQSSPTVSSRVSTPHEA